MVSRASSLSVIERAILFLAEEKDAPIKSGHDEKGEKTGQ
jgi:hypothetical protein